MGNEKFIVVQDVSTANKLIANGFTLVSNMNGTYTFMNTTLKCFNFEDIDTKKLVYTNILAF